MEGSSNTSSHPMWTQDSLLTSSSTTQHPLPECANSLVGSMGGSATTSSSTSSSEELPSVAPKSAYMKYACPACGKEYYNKADYRRHYMTHTGEKPFQCTLCPYRAARFYSLKTHVMARHGPDAMNLMATNQQE